MLANYSTRRTSVVLNPRGGVFGGLGENGDGPPGGGDVAEGGYSGGDGPPGGGDVAEGNYGRTAAEAAFDAATEAAANAIAQAEAASNAAAAYAQQQSDYEAASLAAFQASAYAQQQSDYEAASLAAANARAYAEQQMAYEAASLAAATTASNAAKFAATQMANEAALVAASKALAQSKIDNAATAKTMATIANSAVGFLGPIGLVAGLISRATGFVENAFRDSLNNQQLSYDTNIQSAEQALADARGPAGSDATLTAEINKVQASLDLAKKAGTQAAVIKLYQTYAKRDPNAAELAYWSNKFGASISPDEVQQFQQYLYANEPNLRPAAFATQTTAQPTNNLALPIIAAVAGFLIFGS